MLTALVIGFNQTSYTFDEPNRLIFKDVVLVKENNRTTEQTFDVQINLAVSSGDRSATEGFDFATDFVDGSKVEVFSESVERLPIRLRLFPDNITEGNEEFTLRTSPSGVLRYTLPGPTSNVSRTTTITIIDNDRKLC